MIDLIKAEDEFKKYTQNYDMQLDGIERKYNHSFRVMKISKEIGELKGEHNMQALQYDRWKELLSKNIELGKTYNLDEEFISKIWNIIHEESIKIQSTQK